MNVILFSDEQYKNLNTSLNEIKKLLQSRSGLNAGEFLDSSDLHSMFKISKRTLQSWRSEGHIGYSIIGKKVFYRFSEIEELLKRNYVKPLPKKSK